MIFPRWKIRMMHPTAEVSEMFTILGYLYSTIHVLRAPGDSGSVLLQWSPGDATSFAMAKRTRQQRYLNEGAGAGLVRVETLVPRDGRDAILRLASRLRREARRRDRGPNTGIDVEAVLAKVRALCPPASRRVISASDPDHLVLTSVNVPFANRIDSEDLAEAIRTGRIPPGYRGHIERFLGETPLNRLLAFFDRHHIDTSMVAKFVREHGKGLALHRPDLQEHLRVLSGG